MRIGNIQALPWYGRLGIFVVIAGAIYGLFGYFVTSGTKAETKEMDGQIARLKAENAQAQIAQQRLNEFRASYKLKQQEYDDLKALLPEQRELTSVLQAIQERARTSNLSLRRFSPKDDVQQDFYSGKPIEVQVTSTFANLRGFYEQMARYQRIVSITDFKVSRITSNELNPAKTIDAQFLLTAYYVTPENMKKAAAKPGAPGAPPTAAPGTAPATAPASAAPAPAAK
ncbi:MAG: type pilus assembly protein PilO [Blastocatellia bacterium]|jgi:type IV pilus assembly protein PilO|nr:type pilus assembly protein PilO [Blastocatellia bacterium]